MTSSPLWGSEKDSPVTDLSEFLAWLSRGQHTEGEIYESARRRLILFFASRRCTDPESLSDQVFDRAMKKLNDIPAEANPMAYLVGIAKFVFQDYLREQQKEDIRRNVAPTVTSDSHKVENRHSCLENCLAKLPSDERALVLAYYSQTKQQKIDMRKQLAEDAGLTLNTLRNRIFRLNQRLAHCVTQCLEQIDA